MIPNGLTRNNCVFRILSTALVGEKKSFSPKVVQRLLYRSVCFTSTVATSASVPLYCAEIDLSVNKMAETETCNLPRVHQLMAEEEWGNYVISNLSIMLV